MEWLWVSLGFFLVVLVTLRVMLPNLDVKVDHAIATNDLQPLVAAIKGRREATQVAAYHHSIRRLWDVYQREHAVLLMRLLALDFSTAPVTQYWLKQALSVEPDLAQRHFSQRFLETCYFPEVAARCGPVG